MPAAHAHPDVPREKQLAYAQNEGADRGNRIEFGKLQRVIRNASRHTGQTKEKIAADTNRDNFLTSMEAKAYGIIDEVITRKPVVKEHKE